MITVVKEIDAADGRKRVQIYARTDDSFGFDVLKLSEEPGGDAWILSGKYSECFADTAAHAEAEARSRVAWLAAEPQDV